MYLKSIEIQGFKSFANKTVLQFNEGVTAIVGPNGSGKSNVADAVRWVLGEQKIKQLRGASMQDVIFAGTEVRKPQGFAYVAITLDNSDKKLPVSYTEVTVSRRLYRSGESEYMINDQAVRLRDVQELFYDTGIGREGYSIIGQGQIDAILNGKPEERRGLFDEAAGIVKFKRRKQIAARKLEAEHANLLRITDILNELERQVGPLKKQAEAAEQYLKLRDRLKTYDLNLFIRETESILESLKRAEENFNIVSASLQDAKAENESLKASHNQLSEELSASDAVLNEKKEQLRQGELLSQNLTGQINVAEAEIQADEERVRSLSERIASLKASRAQKEQRALSYLYSLTGLFEELKLVAARQHKACVAETAEAEKEEAQAETSWKERGAADEAPSGAGRERTGEEEKTLSREALSEIDSLLTRLEERIKAYTAELGEELQLSEAALFCAAEEAAKKNEDTEEDGKDLPFDSEPAWMQEIRHKQNDLSALKEREQRVLCFLDQASEQYNKITLVLKDLNRRLNDCQQEYHMAKTRLESLRNLAERYEGYGQSIRSIMQLRGRIGGIRGVVADLIQTEKKYETAVETALGGSIQNIVTDSETAAKQLIGYLKKNRLGRATFLPLDAVRGEVPDVYRKAAKEPGAIGTVSDVVRTEKTYTALCLYLLGRTLLVEDMDRALAIARKYRYTLRIVTMDGELLAPGGSISGGAYRSSSNLIGRVREMDEWKAKMDSILREVDQLNARILAQENEAEEKNREIERLKEETRSILLEKNTLSLSIASDVKLQYTGLSQKTEFISENIARLGAELRESSESCEALLSDRTECSARIRQKQEEIAARKADIAHTEEVLSETRRLIEAETARQKELAASQETFFARRDALSSEILGLEKDLMRVNAQREREQQRLDSQTDYIWTEYELSLSGAKPFFDESLGTAAALKTEIGSLKAKIRALGPVNVQAVEEYKAVSERYDFLHAQHADLTASEESIKHIIADLDAGMRRQFQEKFREIQAEFNRVFQELFGGGLGTLELVEEENQDILEAGIAINAQPPGKKLQNMMQLSGGEKALTAIALLFAIQNLKPSPFCLLDEIEAALDDSNVIRFANYLHKLTKDTQFIVITHRRGTMEAADRLYGITMQEKGVTALVSVDLVSDSLN